MNTGRWPEPPPVAIADLARDRRVRPHDRARRRPPELVGVGREDAVEHLVDERLGVVEDLLHCRSLHADTPRGAVAAEPPCVPLPGRPGAQPTTSPAGAFPSSRSAANRRRRASSRRRGRASGRSDVGLLEAHDRLEPRHHGRHVPGRSVHLAGHLPLLSGELRHQHAAAARHEPEVVVQLMAIVRAVLTAPSNRAAPPRPPAAFRGRRRRPLARR